jgi:hypothetical protein
MFESGPGGDFSTYIGQSTQNIYRVDLGQIHYLGKTLDQLLSSAIESEGGIRNLVPIPEQLVCKVCGTVFSAECCMVDGEEVIDAYML